MPYYISRMYATSESYFYSTDVNSLTGHAAAYVDGGLADSSEPGTAPADTGLLWYPLQSVAEFEVKQK